MAKESVRTGIKPPLSIDTPPPFTTASLEMRMYALLKGLSSLSTFNYKMSSLQSILKLEKINSLL